MTTSTLTVVVRSHEGTPIGGAQVSHVDAQRTTTTTTTDDRGVARFGVPATAPATVTVIASGLAPETRAIGGGYPVAPDGTERFILAPTGWMHYLRGRVRVPFLPVVDAVGVQLEGGATSGGDDGLDGLADGRVTTVGFDDPSVVVLHLASLRAPGSDPGDGDATRAIDPARLRALDDTVREMNHRAEDQPAVGAVGALVALDERGASLLTDEVVVSFVDPSTDPVAVAQQHDLEVVKRFTALPQTYVMRSPLGPVYELLDVVDRLAADPAVRYAEPNLVTTVVNDTVTPNDFLTALQWDHTLIGVRDAWQVLRDLNASHTFGDPAITVAVVDNGVDAGHPVLSGNVSDGTAKVSQIFDFANMVANHNTLNTGSQRDHGMCCASAAAGAADDGDGTAGIAGNCHVIAVRRGGAEARYAEMYLWAAGLDANSSTTGFPAQLTDGADVITNSFGFSVDNPISQLMQDTFTAITDDGRGGLGVPMFFSAGNDAVDLDVTNRRPWSMFGRCYGVAASTLANDGVTEVRAGYSNWGSTVDVCTPSNDNSGPHNPPTSFGAFTATHRSTPEGVAVAGTAATTTTLSTASTAGTMTIEVANVAGATVGGSVLIGPAGNTTSRGRTITAIDAPNRRVTVDAALPAAFANGTTVAFDARRYRTDFGGTSYATPVTAGVAALMLSANPQLRWDEVGDIMRATAVKIDTANTDPNGRWRDGVGRLSTDPAYTGPVFSEWYGAGRIDAAAAVRRAAWTVDLVTAALHFTDIPEGETVVRAVRWNVRSRYASQFTTTAAPVAPFGLPLGSTESLAATGDYGVAQEAYIWVAFTGGPAGTTSSGSITVRHDQTGAQWTIPITANSVAPKTACVMLVLDRSGSMDAPSGVGANKRMDVLHYSAGILVEALHEGDGVGIVGFDHDASTVLSPPVGPLAAPTLLDPVRDTVRAAVTSYAVNPAGSTSIGDGLQLAQSELNPVSTYDVKATVVFTDGYENSSAFIADVASSISDRTYAVALGRAENIRPATLTTVTNGTGGYCVLTNDLGIDSRYKLAKYFLQVLAGVKNDQIVLDPPIAMLPGVDVDVPFDLTETDFAVDVILMTQFPALVDMTLIAPDGSTVDPALVGAIGGRNYVKVGNDVVYYRLTLPAPVGGGQREGSWIARFHLDEKRLRKAYRQGKDGGVDADQFGLITRRGLAGTVLVHASSDLRMDVEIVQKSYEPGADILLRATLREYDLPVAGRAKVHVDWGDPWGGSYPIPLDEVGPGVFEGVVPGQKDGVYTATFHAEGWTFSGTHFTREGVRTAAFWRGGDRYEPSEGEEPSTIRKPDRRRFAWQALLDDPDLLHRLTERLRSAGFSTDDLAPADEPEPVGATSS